MKHLSSHANVVFIGAYGIYTLIMQIPRIGIMCMRRRKHNYT